MRHCHKCGTPRAEDEFRPGRRTCRPCERAESRLYGVTNRNKRNARLSRWRKQNPDKAKAGDRRDRFAEYGLTESEVIAMAREQNGRCKLCNRETALVIDHCHKTKRARGLLCRRCNTTLGWIENHPRILAVVQAYLDQPCHADVLLEIANGLGR